MTEEKMISKEDVKHVAELARLALSSEEETQFTNELNSILDYVKEIDEVTISNYQRFDHYNLKENQFRKDELDVIDEEDKKAIRNLFPQRRENHLRVKETLNGGGQ